MSLVEPVCKIIKKLTLRAVTVEADVEALIELKIPLRKGPTMQVQQKVLLLLARVRISGQLLEILLVRQEIHFIERVI